MHFYFLVFAVRNRLVEMNHDFQSLSFKCYDPEWHYDINHYLINPSHWSRRRDMQIYFIVKILKICHLMLILIYCQLGSMCGFEFLTISLWKWMQFSFNDIFFYSLGRVRYLEDYLQWFYKLEREKKIL